MQFQLRVDSINNFSSCSVEVVVGVLPHFVVRVAKDQSFVGDLDLRATLFDVLLLLFLPLHELIIHAIGRNDPLFACLRVTDVQYCNPFVLFLLL